MCPDFTDHNNEEMCIIKSVKEDYYTGAEKSWERQEKWERMSRRGDTIKDKERSWPWKGGWFMFSQLWERKWIMVRRSLAAQKLKNLANSKGKVICRKSDGGGFKGWDFRVKRFQQIGHERISTRKEGASSDCRGTKPLGHVLWCWGAHLILRRIGVKGRCCLQCGRWAGQERGTENSLGGFFLESLACLPFGWEVRDIARGNRQTFMFYLEEEKQFQD